MKSLQRRVTDFRACGYVKTRLALAAVTGVFSALALRWLAGATLAFLPADSWAEAFARQVIELSPLHFWFAAGIATFGGAASLFYELRSKDGENTIDLEKLSFISGVGHMVVAQFAGLLAYLGAVHYTLSVALGLVGCGLAGWGGGALITAVNEAWVTWLRSRANK